MGALTAVIKHRQAGNPVELSAAKSVFGHTETAAGVLGLLRAAGRLGLRRRNQVLHLHSLNPHITSVLDSGSSAGLTQFAACRQGAPGPEQLGSDTAAGVSAFAFQGTNAHAVLSAGRPAENTSQPQPLSASCWQRRRFWYQPAPHQLLFRAWPAHKLVHFEVSLGRAALDYLWEHQAGSRLHTWERCIASGSVVHTIA